MELELFSGEKTGRPGAPGLRTIGEVSVHDLPWTSGHGERHAHKPSPTRVFSSWLHTEGAENLEKLTMVTAGGEVTRFGRAACSNGGSGCVL
jgi:hypothetical protein